MKRSVVIWEVRVAGFTNDNQKYEKFGKIFLHMLWKKRCRSARIWLQPVLQASFYLTGGRDCVTASE
jgi:hypothetical protein